MNNETIVERVRKLASAAIEGDRLTAVVASLADLPGADTDGLSIRIGNATVRLGALASLRAEASGLEAIAELDLRCAPGVSALVALGDDDGALITEWQAYPGETFAPLKDAADQVEPAACDRFKREMKTLIAAGYIHPYARGLAHLLLADECREIVLRDWGALREHRRREGGELLESLACALERVSRS